jgi:cell wall-associated NlpC family hydrolase
MAGIMGDGAAAARRRYGIAVLSSGLLVTSGVPAAGAVRVDHPDSVLHAVDVDAVAAPVRRALETSPAVSVPIDAAWTFTSPAISVVANPRPQAAPQRAQASSRGAEARQPIRGAEVPASAAGSAAIEIAAQLVGTPYVWGGTTPDGFDCSGFTSYVYAQLGISLSRLSADQRYDGVEVPRDQALPGDLVWSPGHVGLFAGGNLMIDSPRPGKSVQFRDMWQTDPIFIRVIG